VKVRRNCTVELIVDEDAERRLRQLCDLSSKLWNEVNYARLKMWLEKKGIDFEATYREFYEKYKPLIGAVTAQTIIRKNGNAWKSFFRLLELRREGRLPPFMTWLARRDTRRRTSLGRCGLPLERISIGWMATGLFFKVSAQSDG